MPGRQSQKLTLLLTRAGSESFNVFNSFQLTSVEEANVKSTVESEQNIIHIKTKNMRYVFKPIKLKL